MKRELAKRAIDLTQEFLRDYHQQRPQTIYSLCDDKVTWIGSNKDQFVIGLEAFKKEIDNVVAHSRPCHMEYEKFMVVENDGKICTVIGRYLVICDERCEGTLVDEQRCVVLWKQTGAELKILHISTTGPVCEWVEAGEEAPAPSQGRTIDRYLIRHTGGKNTRYLFTDKDGTLLIVPEASIVCVEAQRKHCLLTIDGTTLEVRESLSRVKEKTESSTAFMQVGRSYLINVWHVEKIMKDVIIMDDGTAIRLPEKRRAQIREELRGRYR